MNPLIRLFFGQPRAILALFVLSIAAGAWSYLTLPREADPDIDVPLFLVNVPAPGVSAKDGSRLIGRPLEDAIRGISGIKNVFVTSADSSVSVVAEFSIVTENKVALAEMRAKVEEAKVNFPSAAKEPILRETNFSLFPILVVAIHGDVPERTLLRHAQALEDRIEALSAVLSADISGDRDELVEIIIDPLAISSYRLSLAEVLAITVRNNQLITAGSLDNDGGTFSVKVPGYFQNLSDIQSLPVKVVDGQAITLGDIAEIKRTFKDRNGFTRLNGEPALALNIIKRKGANILETIAATKAIVEELSSEWPSPVRVTTLLDRSSDIIDILTSLQASVITAIILVMIVSFVGLGWRPSLLIGLSIPSSFALSFMVLALLGYTINVMVLFGLVLTVGMLVDNVIVITEYADRKMAEGIKRREAYMQAASRMLAPVLSSTATTLAAFLPLLLWPGVAGQFMGNIPVMVIIVLTSSYISAMVAIPLVGALFGKARKPGRGGKMLRELESGGPLVIRELPIFQRIYASFNNLLLRAPFVPAILISGLVGWIFMSFSAAPTGVEFFVNTEARQAQVFISAYGNLSDDLEIALVDQVEKEVRSVEGIKVTMTRTGPGARPQIVETPAPLGTVGIVSIDLLPFEQRRPSSEILDEVLLKASKIPGVKVEVRKEEQGPPQGKEIQLEVANTDYDVLLSSANKIKALFESDQLDFENVDANLALPGIEWRVDVDREAAGRYGSSLVDVGAMVQLATSGYFVGNARPANSKEEIEVRARFPETQRSLGHFGDLTISTFVGEIPLSNMVKIVPVPAEGTVSRSNGRYSALIRADLPLRQQESTVPGQPGEFAKADPAKVKAQVDELVAGLELPKTNIYRYRGSDEEQERSMAFVGQAAIYALLLMFIILVVQFRSFGQAFLTLLTVVFSVAGVLAGMLITGQKFSIIMTGVGIIGLAGIVVNNAIILIDSYNELRAKGLSARDSAVRASALRLRPIFLTTVTTVSGLVPLALQFNFDIFSFAFKSGGVTSAWWVQLSTAMISGILLSTLMTLVFIPSMLVMGAWVGALPRRIWNMIFDDEPAPRTPAVTSSSV